MNAKIFFSEKFMSYIKSYINVSIQQRINRILYLTPGSIPQYAVRSRFTKILHYYGNK